MEEHNVANTNHSSSDPLSQHRCHCPALLPARGQRSRGGGGDGMGRASAWEIKEEGRGDEEGSFQNKSEEALEC
ncbi:hypothetical protein E2C01_057930 [Portunus trituberculatus]|uniref:Uncharacterized protein n=1 Tax=Portunus trituberculatus TaxID=210409 RepID=A0A5B7H4P4_PORTR|nr:hypothetical protein [Portunus trituberculatus]